MFKIKTLFKGDNLLWCIIMSLLLFSIVVVYSSAFSQTPQDKAIIGDFAYNARIQFIYVFAGFFTIWFISAFISPSWVVRISRVLVIAFIILSFMVYIPYIGVESYGAHRWLKVPFINVNFCPFDFLRVFVMVDLAAQLTKRAGSIGRMYIVPDFGQLFNRQSWVLIWDVTLPLLWTSLAAMFVVIKSNISTSFIIFVMMMVMLRLGNVRRREWWKLLGYAVVLGGLFLTSMVVFNYWRGPTLRARIEGIFSKAQTEAAATNDTMRGGFVSMEDLASSVQSNDQSHYQKEMAKVAVASGGIKGKGPGNSTLRSQLPHSYDDCVFAFIMEEYGLVGGFLVIGAYMWLLIRGGSIARRSKYYAFSLLSYGIVIQIALTAAIHMLVSVGFFVTGQTLPLISKGGSSILANSVALGLLLAISACPTRDQSDKAEPEGEVK